MEFVSDLLKLLDDHDAHDQLWWRCGPKYGGGEFAKPASFFVNCNDLFWWATADCEEITPDNLPILRQAFEDCAKHKEDVPECSMYANGLFAARVRGMRPQRPAYPKRPDLSWLVELYDQCGPERDPKSEG